MLRVALLHPTFRPSSLALAILATSAPLVQAEDTQLQTVTVQARQADDDALPSRPPASIYGGLEAKVLDTPRSVTQINAEQLARDPIRSSDDLVKYAPGSPVGWPERRHRAADARSEQRGVPGRPARLWRAPPRQLQRL